MVLNHKYQLIHVGALKKLEKWDGNGRPDWHPGFSGSIQHLMTHPFTSDVLSLVGWCKAGRQSSKPVLVHNGTGTYRT